MSTIQQNKLANRRDFLGKLAGTAALIGMSNLPLTLSANPEAKKDDPQGTNLGDPDEWLKANIKGKHKIVFDCPEPKELMTFAWPKAFLLTNQATGTEPKDCSVVIVLRHNAIPYVLGDSLWAKYNLGEVFKINDPRTGAAATRNPFWETKPDDFKLPGIGAIPLGIRDLQADGVLICACDLALTVFSAVIAMKSNQDATAVKKEWVAGMLPSIQVMPSGVWAVGRAQEHGCTYCFAG
ncbi:MAG TPA: twin-arginine translocation signal domain-containing protein [Puia sp.]|nr:twin-arginine translocation signal domain-containing protein [Puia sp.]